ncbi:MAG: DUF4202 domain-containing protein [Methylocystis sp.]|nr:DUF4202 domain-containing protein [Methylocystis sp.]
MSAPTGNLEAVFAALDAANADDPRKVVVDGAARSFETLYAERMTARLAALYPDASNLLKIAARAQHLRRWEIARDRFPPGRHGYNDWRKECRAHHALLAGAIMREHGFDDDAIRHVAMIIRKERMKKDREAQALENVAAIVFIEHYFDDFHAKYPDYDDDKMIDILGKTLCKMSPKGHAGALALPLPATTRRLVAAAIERQSKALERLAAVAVD